MSQLEQDIDDYFLRLIAGEICSACQEPFEMCSCEEPDDGDGDGK